MSRISEIFQPNLVAYDLFQMLTGNEVLGYGVARVVYPYLPNNKFVVKFEEEDSFQNITEWQTWQHIKSTEYAKWFAPCDIISPCGRILIQRRTRPVTSDKQLISHIPTFFTDTKVENWGILNGKLVCHDYGDHLLLEKGMSKRMQKVNWW